MSTDEERERHRQRRKRTRSVIARELELKQYRQRKVPNKKKDLAEDEDERRFRRYKDISELGIETPEKD